MNDAMKKVVHEQIMKLWYAGIIYSVPYNEWISPIVMVPKKGGAWRLCVDYKRLNELTEKDPFLLPLLIRYLIG